MSTSTKKKYLWGGVRYASEVIYVCEDLLGDYEYVPTEEFNRINYTNGLIIVCDYNMEERIKFLEDMGLAYKEDYLPATDLFLEMDKISDTSLTEKRQIAFWGCGKNAKKIGEMKIVDFYIDSNKDLQGKEFLGKRILHPTEITDWKKVYVFIVVGAPFIDEIAEFLTKKGLEREKDFFVHGFNKFRFLPSKMMMKTLYDRPVKNFYCNMGMQKVDFSGDGNMYACCGARIAPSIGNLFNKTSLQEEWNSYRAKIIKLSLINNTYSFCSTKKCAGLLAKNDSLEYEDLDYAGADYLNKGEPYPPLATICVDYTCNLKCESCRSDYRKANEEEIKRRKYLADKISRELMPNVNEVVMAGNGEVFYSKLYRDMWINTSGVKRKGIIVKSNGILFNQKNWELLSEGYENISLDISIDGASEKVYEEVRRGGKWSVLYKNMEFAAALRKAEKIKSFTIEFVVQQKNYQDAKAFVKLGKRWGCDSVVFARIYNWGTYEPEDFNNNITLFEDNGTGKIKDKYRTYFEAEIFDDPIVKGIPVFRN